MAFSGKVVFEFEQKTQEKTEKVREKMQENVESEREKGAGNE
jgi:hypothetical protein